MEHPLLQQNYSRILVEWGQFVKNCFCKLEIDELEPKLLSWKHKQILSNAIPNVYLWVYEAASIIAESFEHNFNRG